MMKRLSSVIVIVVALLLSGCGGAVATGPTAVPPTPQPITNIDPAKEIVDFSLTNQADEKVSLHDYKGKLILLAFGYTHCPDVCPVTLARFKQVKDALGTQADKVNFVFISVDGERDTPTRMNEYLAMFDPAFVGLTGDQTAARDVIHQYGGEFVIKDAEGLRKNYSVDHTATSFLMSTDGKWIRTYAYNTAPEIIVPDIKGVLGA